LYVEIRVTVTDGQASKYAADINECLSTFISCVEEGNFYPFIFNLKALVIDDNTVAIGQKFHAPIGKAKVPEDILGVLNKAGQHLNFYFALGTSVEEILESKESITMSLLKDGFKASTSQCLVSYFNRVLVELTKTEDEKINGALMAVGMFSPALMLSINANVDLEFEDFDEILNHPMAQPMLVAFEQIFEQLNAPAGLDELKAAKFDRKLA
jgi:hypothetical protein